MAGEVTFNYATWVAQYPEFSQVTSPTAQGYFDSATLYLNNSATSVVTNLTTRKQLLYLLTAHLAFIFSGKNGQGAPGLVGRVANAAEGSVNVGAEMPSAPSAAWFNQSPYGAAFWQATLRYRTARWTTPSQPFYQPRGAFRYPWG